jgi:hypothetical protein
MKVLEFEMPLYLTIPRKTKEDKKITLSSNVTNTLHHLVFAMLKKQYTEMIKSRIGQSAPWAFEGEVRCDLFFYAKAGNQDEMNFASIASKFGDDAVQEIGFVPNDKQIKVHKVTHMGNCPKNPRMIFRYTQLIKKG